MYIKEIQQRLRDAIKQSGKSHKQIAIETGVSESTISKYMHTDKFPSFETFGKLCKAIDASADEIYGL